MHSSPSNVQTPRARTVQLPSIAVHYLEWGEAGQRPLVFLHGGGQTAYTWQRVAERFATDYHILAPDARGHGDSGWSPTGEYHLDDFRDDLRAFVETLGLNDFVLAGMSMGGVTSLAYAGEYGDTLRGLMIVDVAPKVEAAGRDRILGFMRGRKSFDSLDEAVDYAHAFNPLRSPEALRLTLPQNLRRHEDGRLRWKWDPAFVGSARQTEQQIVRAELWDVAARIPCPTLVIHGAQSDVLSRETGERLAATIPQGRLLTISGAGHSVQGDNPRNLGDALAGLLKEIDY